MTTELARSRPNRPNHGPIHADPGVQYASFDYVAGTLAGREAEIVSEPRTASAPRISRSTEPAARFSEMSSCQRALAFIAAAA